MNNFQRKKENSSLIQDPGPMSEVVKSSSFPNVCVRACVRVLIYYVKISSIGNIVFA